jgi:ureidoacrylate peracid hydrolase
VAEILTPKRTAIIVVDVQNDFCDPDGAFARNGMAIEAGRRILAPLARLLEGARLAGVRVVYLRFVEDYSVVSQIYDRQRYRAGGSLRYCRDEWGRRIVAELQPTMGDPVIDKVRASGFFSTRLDITLRCGDTSTLVLTGMATESCVLATAIDATDRDYYVVLAPDCLASFSQERHDAALKILTHKHPALASHEIFEIWKRR